MQQQAVNKREPNLLATLSYYMLLILISKIYRIIKTSKQNEKISLSSCGDGIFNVIDSKFGTQFALWVNNLYPPNFQVSHIKVTLLLLLSLLLLLLLFSVLLKQRLILQDRFHFQDRDLNNNKQFQQMKLCAMY